MKLLIGLDCQSIFDNATRNRVYGHFSRILVDVDLLKMLHEYLLLEREDYALHLKCKCYIVL